MRAKIYGLVINLDRSPERWLLAKDAFKYTNISAERLSAVDGENLENQPSQLERLLKKHGRKFQLGELACYYSHINALDKFIASKKEFILVLEDDARPSANINEIVDILELVRCSEHLHDAFINLANPPHKLFRHTNNFGSSNKLLRCYHFPISSMAIIWSRAAAKEFLATYREPNLPFDCALRDFNRSYKKGYGVKDQLVCGDLDLASEIEKFGQRRKRSISKGWKLKAWRLEHTINAFFQKLADT